MLQVNNVSKKYGATIVLNQVNLMIDANNIVGLAGPSGSGKSTLLRCIQQLETPDSGTIYLAGTCGFMFQDFQLFPHMNVLTNLIYAPNLKDKSINHEQKATEILNKLSISDKSLSYPHQLSGGQKQRVALARSLMMKPDLLLCDEPTSGLDRTTIKEVISLLKGVKEMKVTMLIASHDLTFLSHIADRTVVMSRGSVTAETRMDQV